MKLDLKITPVAFAFALLTACGGGGGGGGGDTGTGPQTGIIQPNSDIFTRGIESTNTFSKLKPISATESDSNFDPLASNNRQDSQNYPGFTLYKGTDAVHNVEVYGLQLGTIEGAGTENDPYTLTSNISGNSAVVMIFDQNGGIVASGANMTGSLPAGPIEYQGWNFFKYTANAPSANLQGVFQSGSFTMNVNFSDGTGTFTTKTVASVVRDNQYAGTSINNAAIRIDTDEGEFSGNNITLIETTSATSDNSNPTNGASKPVFIAGQFHGATGEGVAAVYYHESADITQREFHGAMIGDRCYRGSASNGCN